VQPINTDFILPCMTLLLPENHDCSALLWLCQLIVMCHCHYYWCHCSSMPYCHFHCALPQLQSPRQTMLAAICCLGCHWLIVVCPCHYVRDTALLLLCVAARQQCWVHFAIVATAGLLSATAGYCHLSLTILLVPLQYTDITAAFTVCCHGSLQPDIHLLAVLHCCSCHQLFVITVSATGVQHH